MATAFAEMGDDAGQRRGEGCGIAAEMRQIWDDEVPGACDAAVAYAAPAIRVPGPSAGPRNPGATDTACTADRAVCTALPRNP